MILRVTTIALVLFMGTNASFAQKTIKEYTEKAGKEKIKKKIVIGAEPTTAGGYGDGHGKTPLLTSTSQLPDTVALVTYYIYDLGTSNFSDAGNVGVSTYYFVSEKGGNLLANEALSKSIDALKQAFKKQNVVLLTPDQYLNTPEKKAYYYTKFKPTISGIGKFLSGIENKHTDIAVGADDFRVFDLSASVDYLRAESLGGDMAKQLGVDGLLSIAVEVQSDKRNIEMHGIKMTLHGPNPIPKEDKKYIGQKMGTGYYAGQIYANGTFFFDKAIHVASYEKKKLDMNMQFDGVGVVFESFIEKFYESMHEAIDKAAKKYN